MTEDERKLIGSAIALATVALVAAMVVWYWIA